MPIPIRDTDLVYFPVPKVACTSIKRALVARQFPDEIEKIPYRDKDGVLRTAHTIFPSIEFEWKMPFQLRNKRWFCVVRDPVRRFLSGYSNRLDHHRDLSATDDAILLAHGLSPQPDVEEFAERLVDYMAVNGSIRHHFQPMTRFLGIRARRFDRIFNIRELDKLPAYCADAGAEITLPHAQTGGTKVSPDMLSAQSLAALKGFYAEDYKAFGLYFE